MKSKTANTPRKPELQKSMSEPEPDKSERIRMLAYLKWEAAGRPECDGTCYWFEAESEVRDGRPLTAGSASR